MFKIPGIKFILLSSTLVQPRDQFVNNNNISTISLVRIFDSRSILWIRGPALNKTVGIFSSKALYWQHFVPLWNLASEGCVCILFASSSLVSLCPRVKTCSFYTNKALSSSHERSQFNDKYFYWFILLGPILTITSMEENAPVQMFLEKNV